MPTVDTMIEEARFEDPSFTDRRHTGRALRVQLADYQDELLGKVADMNPRELAEPYVVTLPLASFTAGHELVEIQESVEVPLRFKKILDWGETTGLNGLSGQARHIAMGSRWGPHRLPSFWIRDGRLYLVGDSPKVWTGVATLTIYYVPSPPATLAGTDELLFGDQARRVWRRFLAYRMASRSKPDELASPKAQFEADFLQAEQAFLDDIAGRYVSHDIVREVW